MRICNLIVLLHGRAKDIELESKDDPKKSQLTRTARFRTADEEARKQGRHIAQWAFAHILRPLDE